MYKKISIVTPSYNQGEFIENTINSVLDQKYPNLEYIIIDGGSTDNTVNILKKYSKYLTYWESKKDRGQAHAINKGFKKATGEILGYLNSDDTYEPITFNIINEYFYLKKDPIVTGITRWIDKKSQTLDYYNSYSQMIKSNASTINKLRVGCYIGQPSTFFTKQLYKEIGPFNEKYQCAFDYEYWIRVSKKYEINTINVHLANTRLHRLTKTHQENLKSFVEVKEIQKEHFGNVHYWIMLIISDLLIKKKDQKYVWKKNLLRIFISFRLYITELKQLPPIPTLKQYIKWIAEIIYIPRFIKQILIKILLIIKSAYLLLKHKKLSIALPLLVRFVGPKYIELGILNQHKPKRRFKETFPNYVYKQKITKKISIVTPSYNQGEFIENTINSVLDQKYPNLEYIIIDGGSTDNTVNILKKYSKYLTYWESKKDRGQAHAINKGFKKATGEILGYLNSDDILLKGSLSYINDFFVKNINVDVVYGNRLIINHNYRQIGRWILAPHSNIIARLVDFIPQETLYWRRSIWNKTKYFNENYMFAMDWDLIQQFISKKALIKHVPYFLGAFLVHEKQKTTSEYERSGYKECLIIENKYNSSAFIKRNKPKIENYILKSAIYSYLFDKGIRL